MFKRTATRWVRVLSKRLRKFKLRVRLCRFWCLLDVVEADLKWEVSQFAEAIQEKKN